MYTGHTGTIFGMMALTGVGSGLRFMAAPLHGVGQFRQDRAAVIGLLAVSIPFGGTIGLTIMSAVFNNTSGLDANADFSHFRDAAPDVAEELKEKAKMGVVWGFVAITPILFLVRESLHPQM
jgi:hypothetical protein